MVKIDQKFFNPKMTIYHIKYFSVDKLTDAKKIFLVAIFYRKKGQKVTFDFGVPQNPAN